MKRFDASVVKEWLRDLRLERLELAQASPRSKQQPTQFNNINSI